MSKVRIFALGGLDEDGKNMYVVENNDDIFVIECGLRYPNDENLGVEMIIPDFNYLMKNQKRIKGIFITHGHDDVMGALPDLCKQVKAPIYMAPLTARMFERMARREGIKDVQVHRVRRNSTFKIGSTESRTFGTTQSIADGFGVAIRTEDGYVVYTSEFIVDYDVKNDAFKFDMMDVTELGQKGILALMRIRRLHQRRPQQPASSDHESDRAVFRRCQGQNHRHDLQPEPLPGHRSHRDGLQVQPQDHDL